MEIGTYRLVVRYHLFGEEPFENEPVAATLSGTHLCASLVYAHCYRLDLVSSKAKKKWLLRMVAASAPNAGLPAVQNLKENGHKVKRCSECHREEIGTSADCALIEFLPSES